MPKEKKAKPSDAHKGEISVLRTKGVQDKLYTILFLLIPFVAFCVSTLVPFILGNFVAFMKWDGIKATREWIGFENYKEALTEKKFWRAMWFSVRYSIASVISVNIVSLALAILLNLKIKTRNFLRLLLFLPQLIGGLLVGYVWKFILGTIFPIIGSWTGIPLMQTNWLGNKRLAFISLVMVATWAGMGYYLLIYLAALQGVPMELLEAATIDGAGFFKKLWHVSLPIIRHAFTICIFLSALGGMRVYDPIYVMTQGGPVGSTESVVWNLYMTGFNAYDYGLGSAKSIVFFVILVAFSIIQISVMRRKEVEL